MRRSWSVLAAGVVVSVLGVPPVGAAPDGRWSPPVGGPVVRGYEPPRRPFGPRHLGLDYAVPPGTTVRAAGGGVVAFAGRVGGAWAVAVDHAEGRRSTYAYLRRVRVRPGTPVRRGDVLGLSGAAGPGHGPGVVHFGYRVNGRAEDPAPLFRASESRISLAPLDRPACPSRLKEASGRPATLGANPTAPGRESARPQSIGVRP